MNVHAGHLRFAAKSVFARVRAIKDAKVNLASQVYCFTWRSAGAALILFRFPPDENSRLQDAVYMQEGRGMHRSSPQLPIRTQG